MYDTKLYREDSYTAMFHLQEGGHYNLNQANIEVLMSAKTWLLIKFIFNIAK